MTVTLVVPTRNRGYTLEKVLTSYLTQDDVSEVILVDDAGDDDTAEVVERAKARHPYTSVRIIKNAERMGAAYSRQAGARAASNPYILFCDDDEYLEAGYARRCRDLLTRTGVGAVSGRRVYMRGKETPEQAILRFGDGVRNRAPFDRRMMQLVNGARFRDVKSLPFTNAIILTHRDLVLKFGFDSYYSRGNGYREESDFQLNLYLSGYEILVAPDVHSIHLPMSEVRRGGQRVNPFAKFMWSVHYNEYFLDKYYEQYRSRERLAETRWIISAFQTTFLFWWHVVRPPIFNAYMGIKAHFRPSAARPG